MVLPKIHINYEVNPIKNWILVIMRNQSIPSITSSLCLFLVHHPPPPHKFWVYTRIDRSITIYHLWIPHFQPPPLRGIPNPVGVFFSMWNKLLLNPTTQSMITLRQLYIKPVYFLIASVASSLGLSGKFNLLHFPLPFVIFSDFELNIFDLLFYAHFWVWFHLYGSESEYKIKIVP